MGVGLVRKGATGSVSHSQATPTLLILITPPALRDTYGATFSFIEQGQLTLVMSGSTPTTPAAGSLTFFSKSRAGKMIPSVIDPSGVDFNLQSALHGTTTFRFMANNNNTYFFWGNSWTSRLASGTETFPGKSSTNAMLSMNRVLYATANSANTSGGIQSTDRVVWRGNAAGLGGFLFFSRFGLQAIGASNRLRVLVGLSDLNGTMTQDPSTYTLASLSGGSQVIGLIKDAGDTNLQFFIRNGTTQTKQDTGVAPTVNQILDLYIHAMPNGTNIMFQLNESVGGTTLASATLSTGIPANTQFLYAHVHVGTSASSSVQSLSVNQIYVETDL
jgi:hypothetical protein